MSSFLQSKPWADFRESLGWQAHWIDEILVLERSLLLGKSFLYAPEVELRVRKLEVRELVQSIKTIKTHRQPIFFRLELLNQYPHSYPEVSRYSHSGSGFLKTLREQRFVKAFEEVQPEWRQIIDLAKPEQKILSQMKPKGRYNIGLSKRHGVDLEQTDDLGAFYRLYQTTLKRARLSGRPLEYFNRLRQFFPTETRVFIASYRKKPLAAAFVMFWDNIATYLYGGSSDEHREVMAPFLLHWEIIKEAKRRGCKEYDLGAVAPQATTDDQQSTINRQLKLIIKYSGLSRFKQQFGGRIVHITGSYDLIFQPWWYRLYRSVETLRRK